MKLRKVSFFVLVGSFAFLSSGCVPIIIGGGLGAGGYMAMRDKSVSESASDTKIETVVKARLYKIHPDLYSNVSVNVDDGCVLLTGVVNNESWIAIAEKEAWAVEGVVVVDNNIIFGKTLGVSTILSDAAITSKARTNLICNKDVKSVNYKIKTIDSIIYIRGMAKSQNELNSALNTLQHVSGVKKVVSYVNIMP